EKHGRLFMATENAFEAVKETYAATLRWTLEHQRFAMAVFLAIVVATGFLFAKMPKGFMPSEDSGQLFCFTEAPQDISFDAMADLQGRVAEIIRQHPDVEAAMSFVGAGGN